MSAAQEFIPSYITPQPGEVDSLDRIFDALDSAIDALSTETNLHLEMFGDPEAACQLLLRTRDTRKRLQELEAAVEATAAQRMTGKELRWGDFVAERRGGWRRVSWRHDDVAWRLIADIAVDARTGEVSEDLAAAVSAARDRIVNAASISGWRVTQLRPAGIDPDDYSESIESRRTVEVRRNVEGDK